MQIKSTYKVKTPLGGGGIILPMPLLDTVSWNNSSPSSTA